MRIASTDHGCEEAADGLSNASPAARKQKRKKKSQKRGHNATDLQSCRGTGVSSVLDPNYHGLTAPSIGAVNARDTEATVENRFVALCVVRVPDDRDCLFHALSLFDAGMGGCGYALRNRLVEFMEARAAEQDGFEEVWRLETQLLRNYWIWGGHTATAAYTLMTGMRVMLHIHEADSSSTTVIEASHATVAGNTTAPVRHLLYNGMDHYDALEQVGDLVGFQPAWPQALPEGNPLPPSPRAQGHNTEVLQGLLGTPHIANPWGYVGLQRDAVYQGRAAQANSASANPTTNDANEGELYREVYEYICAVMQPDSHSRWGQLGLWQEGLQTRCWGQSFPCPFWYAVLYDLDLRLHLEIETFVRMLQTGTLSLDLLYAWQQKLQRLPRRLWFPRGLWYRLIQQTNLNTDPDQVRRSLAALFGSND